MLGKRKHKNVGCKTRADRIKNGKFKMVIIPNPGPTQTCHPEGKFEGVELIIIINLFYLFKNASTFFVYSYFSTSSAYLKGTEPFTFCDVYE